ncbi:MAG TPA: Crp/Fnr family transcriptional regulator [Steroidobacteraceae bacterium]|nr:Crp/Fnr family transcriptional regulator [Steroidobacteraceae bacterium]
MHASSTPAANRLLRALPAADCRRLFPQLEAVNLRPGATLFEPAAPAQFAYFPVNSVVTLSYPIGQGAMAKCCSIGRDGMVGVSLFLDGPEDGNRAEVESGGLAFRLSAAALRAEFHRAGALQRLLLRYVYALVTQSSQLCVCQQHHTVGQRLCGLLSRAFSEANGKVAFITQARIGELLGVRRESITEVASRLQGARIIEYCRGQITLLDRARLEERACACDRIIRRALAAVSQ